MTTYTQNIGQFLLYTTNGGKIKIQATFEDETIWLNQEQMGILFDTTKQNISLHLQNCFESGEISQEATVKDFLTVQKEGNREVKRNITFYNLDAIIAVGYRVNSYKATKFRIWATNVLKEYIKKGFVMDDDRLKELGGGNYWKELLDRIKDIRSSEKVMYRQVLDLYATSVDYDPKNEETTKFFKMVQNKLHFAAHGQTASEVIYNRADAEKEFMGLTTFKGSLPIKSETTVAKNYLDEKELKKLNNIVSGYFDFAEAQAMEHKEMTMKDYREHLYRIIKANNYKLLIGNGKITHNQAAKKAHSEYKKYQVKTLSDIEKAYLDNLKMIEEKVKK